MRQEGKEMYGEYAYGPYGTMIDTNSAFKVRTEFISTKNYENLWKVRTVMNQGESEMILEADCRNYINQLNNDIEGGMGIVFSSWDNRSGKHADFEVGRWCPEPT
jgi:hypothetical protein